MLSSSERPRKSCSYVIPRRAWARYNPNLTTTPFMSQLRDCLRAVEYALRWSLKFSRVSMQQAKRSQVSHSSFGPGLHRWLMAVWILCIKFVEDELGIL